MSIPRLAIQRPVTMFMISAVITLLGLISLTRLPVDLMPEFEQPTLTACSSGLVISSSISSGPTSRRSARCPASFA